MPDEGLVKRLIAMHAGDKLDMEIDCLVFGHPTKAPTRDWSQDERAAHAIYDPLAKKAGWQLTFDAFGEHRGWQVRKRDGELMANGYGSACLAMVRAVIVYHLIIKLDDGAIPPAKELKTSEFCTVSKRKRKAADAYALTSSAT